MNPEEYDLFSQNNQQMPCDCQFYLYAILAFHGEVSHIGDMY